MKNILLLSLYPILGICFFLCAANVLAQLSATELDRISAFDAFAGDSFGVDVDIDGDRAVIGARFDDDGGGNSGSAYVYFYNPITEMWEEEKNGKLVHVSAFGGDLFGSSVAIEGDTIVVGAPQDDINEVEFKGSAHVFTRGPEGWDVGQELLPMDDNLKYENYGISVDIDNDTIVVGVAFDDDNDKSVDSGASGSAYVYELVSEEWTRTATLLPPDTEDHQNFGWSVAIDMDTIVVGAPHWTESGLGEAYVFTRSDGWSDSTKLPVTDNLAGDNFGWSVAVSGDVVVVGARLDEDAVNGVEAGSITIFERSGTNWDHKDKLVASNGEQGDYFGNDVATNGEAVIAGSPFSRSFDKGSSYSFSKSGNNWVEDEVIAPSSNAANISAIQQFGGSLALDGETLFVGAPTSDIFNGSSFIFFAGAAFVYEVSAPPAIIADYGDAPLHNIDSYHLTDSGLKLGQSVDTEEAAQANAAANGDDNDGSDDEDGVFFRTAFIKGGTTLVGVFASGPGFLNAWADFGTGWNDASEQIFTDEPLVAGINELSFVVPDSGNEGEDAALRFRFSTQTGLGPSGAAPDGEMEDYVMRRNSSSEEDPDNDGVVAAIEDAGPNGGDGNMDGIADSLQLNVTSIPTAEGSDYLVIESQPGTFLTNVSTVDPDTLGPPPPGASFPLGALQFNVEGMAPGAAVEVVILFPEGVLVSSYFKYSDHWYEFLDDGMTGATVTPGKVVLKLVDGGRGDHDLSANGVIEDPGAIALSDTFFKDGFED